MELREFIMHTQVPVYVIIAVVVVAAVITAVTIYQYLKYKGVQGIREEVYKLMLRAEHKYKSGEGKKKFMYVVGKARGLLPEWLQLMLSEEELYDLVQIWFDGIKDLMDDGKVNESTKG